MPAYALHKISIFDPLRDTYLSPRHPSLRNMPLAHHLILSFYGFWLPNDERGSWSDRVRKYELRRFGPVTRVTTRRSFADSPFDPIRREEMRYVLKHHPVQITGQQARLVASGFAYAYAECEYKTHACAIMPNHVHLVIARHGRPIEKIASHLKAKATRHLNGAGMNPLPRSPWSKGHWVVYLNTPQQVMNAIRYTQNNPVKDGLRKQTWKFVTPYV